MGYILGLDGKCCNSCTPANPCASKPIITGCGSGTFYTRIYGSAAGYSSGSNLTGATWSMSAFDGLSINASTGQITGTVPLGGSGTYYITVTATNACGSSNCSFTLTLVDCGTCPVVLIDSGTANYSNTVSATGCGPVFVTYDMDTVVYDRLKVYADASLIYDSGCVLGSGGSTINIPPGTTTITVTVDADCTGSGGGTIWSFGLFC
jgi:hypothetical protein